MHSVTWPKGNPSIYNIMNKYIPKFIRRVVSFIFSSNHLIGYNHILLETHQKKIIRLYQDNAYFTRQKQYAYEDQPANVRKFLNMLTAFLYRDNQCINPCIKKLLIWYAIVFVAFMYFFIQVGMMLAFGQPAWIYQQNTPSVIALNVIFLVVLYVDIFMQFITGYIARGVLVRQPQKVVAHYLRYMFLIDLVVVLVESIALGASSFTINYFRMLIVLKFLRIFQIDKFYLRRLSLHKILKTIYVIIKQMIIIFNTSHVAGIIFYIIDYHFVKSPLCQQNQDFCWLYNSTAYSPIIELGLSYQYFYIVYYGISTISTISYGDIQAHNPYEQIYEIPLFIFSFIIYAYIINNIINIILWARKQSDQLKSQTLLIEVYMKDLHIKQELKQEILSYLKFLYVEQLSRDKQSEQQLLSKLPEDLRFELFQGLYHQMYSGMKFMLDAESPVKNLLLLIQQSIYTGNEEIIPQNQFMTKLVFIQRGVVRIDCQIQANNYPIAKVNSKNFVGHSYFFKQEKLQFSIVAHRSSTIYAIDYKQYQQSCRANGLKQQMKKLQYQVKICQNYQKLMITCYFCSERHMWNECPGKFPLFQRIQLASSSIVKQKREQAKQRGLRHNVLVCKNSLKVLAVFTKISEDQFYNKIQKRLKTIKEKIEISRQLFQVDTAYDWQVYCPEANLSKIRIVWEEKKLQKNLSRISLFRKSRQIGQ